MSEAKVSYILSVLCVQDLSISMGVWDLASVLLCLLLQESSQLQNQPHQNPIKRETTKSVNEFNELLLASSLVSNLAIPNQQPIKASSSNYLPYSIVPYSLEESNHNYPIQESSDHGITKQFSSIEVEQDSYNDKDFHEQGKFLDTTGYKEYGSQTSFSLEGPKQVEIIDTRNYHKEVEPYETNEYKKYHHQEEEEHAEMHYHQHKHLHKHKHKQDHKHKHKEDHLHEHNHKHQHKAQHEHKHKQEHKHYQHSDHKHEHKSHHEHKHKQEHKHDHHNKHKHEHKHKEEHKHEGHHKHKHEEWSDHKHHNEHKHDHHHGHKHWNDHKHNHKHHNSHNHKHDHQEEHKHKHNEKSHHYHSKHKHW